MQVSTISKQLDSLVDVDDPSTWPTKARSLAETVADRFDDPDDSLLDGIAFEEERLCRELVAEAQLRAYHCTRLLDHEVAMIRETGLRVLTRDLIAARLDAARLAGAISAEEAEHLKTENFLKDPLGPISREHLLHLFLGRKALDTEASLNHFLEEWGGEVISFWHERTPYRERLSLLGSPAVVVAAIDLQGDSDVAIYPGLLQCLVARLLEREGGASVVCKHPVTRILDIWQPGHGDYDRHTSLTQA